MSTIYSASQIVGKTLIANTAIQVKRVAADSSPVVRTIAKGQSVGLVYSYLPANTTRKSLYWMFYDSYNTPYYVEHKTGIFSIKGLTAQGALTIEEERAQQDGKEKDAFDKTKDIVQLGLIGVGIWGGVQLIKTFKPT